MRAFQILIEHPFCNGGFATGARKPKTTFVGYFIGSPAMNIYPCDAVSDDEVCSDDKDCLNDEFRGSDFFSNR